MRAAKEKVKVNVLMVDDQPAKLDRILTGDKVTVELTPYDLSRGRIIYRDTGKPRPTEDEPPAE